MTDEEADPGERDWIDGNRAAWRRMLGTCLHELLAGVERTDVAATVEREIADGEVGYTTTVRLGQLVAERQDALRALRELCKEHGDNSFPDDLNLGDAIEKFLGRYLENHV